MCGRFAITLPSDAMAHLFEAQPANDLPPVPNFNVCPTNQVHSIVSADAGRRMTSMRWGFLPHWYKSPTDGPLLINARSETLAEKPAFATPAGPGAVCYRSAAFMSGRKTPMANGCRGTSKPKPL